MYEIEYTPKAIVDLKSFKKHERNEVLDAIESQLRYEPTIETRNRKRMRPNKTSDWELRVGDFRVFYNVDDTVRIVEIQRVGIKRGNRLFFRGKVEEL